MALRFTFSLADVMKLDELVKAHHRAFLKASPPQASHLARALGAALATATATTPSPSATATITAAAAAASATHHLLLSCITGSRVQRSVEAETSLCHASRGGIAALWTAERFLVHVF